MLFRSNQVNFGVGVRNIGTQDQFSITLGFSGAYTPDGREICRAGDACASYIEQKWLGAFATIPAFSVKKNDQKVIPLLVKADVNIDSGKPTITGDYVFNVCVYNEQQGPCSIGQFQLNSQLFYTGKIYQITVRVV